MAENPSHPLTPEAATEQLMDLLDLRPARDLTHIRALLDAGANSNVCDQVGCTPLHRAAAHNLTEAITLLIEHGADPNRQDQFGCTPLHYACKHREYHSAVALLAGGANPSLVDHHQRTPLHIASQWPAGTYDFDPDATLIYHPLTPLDAKDEDGRTALDIAISENAERTAMRLVVAGAYVNVSRHGENLPHSIQRRMDDAYWVWNRYMVPPDIDAIDMPILLRLANIGKLPETFDPANWVGHEDRLLELFQQLRPCHQHLVISQCHAMRQFVTDHPAPSSQVNTSDLAISSIGTSSRGRA